MRMIIILIDARSPRASSAATTSFLVAPRAPVVQQQRVAVSKIFEKARSAGRTVVSRQYIIPRLVGAVNSLFNLIKWRQPIDKQG